jgi:hypothetical protein
MGFVQIIDMRTSRFDELQALGEEWAAAAAGESTARRRVLCQDRNDPGRYLNIVFFDSYDHAVENSKHPTTQEYSPRWQPSSTVHRRSSTSTWSRT